MSWNEGTCQIDDDGSSIQPGSLDVRSAVLAEDSGAGANDGITVYYPAIIESSDCTFKVIGWGNDSSGSGGAHYPKYFSHLASHGFVVAVPHTNLTVADSRPILSAVEVVMQASEEPSSLFFQKIESDFGLMGKSLGAIAVAREMSEENAVAAVLIGSGSSPETALTKPGLFATGDEDYLQRMVRGAYDASSGDAIYAQAAQTEGGFADGHFELGLDDHEGIVQLSTSFMRCHLRGNASACQYLSCRRPVRPSVKYSPGQMGMSTSRAMRPDGQWASSSEFTFRSGASAGLSRELTPRRSADLHRTPPAKDDG